MFSHETSEDSLFIILSKSSFDFTIELNKYSAAPGAYKKMSFANLSLRQLDMIRCIERHQRWISAANCLAGASKRMGYFRAHALGLTVALSAVRLLERSAWRRLIKLKAKDSGEARQKILYIFSSVAAEKSELFPGEIPRLIESIRGFETEISNILQRSKVGTF